MFEENSSEDNSLSLDKIKCKQSDPLNYNPISFIGREQIPNKFKYNSFNQQVLYFIIDDIPQQIIKNILTLFKEYNIVYITQEEFNKKFKDTHSYEYQPIFTIL